MPIRDRREERLLKVSATDDTLMDDTPPGCSFANFKQPKLRRCPYDISSVIIRSRRLNKIDPNHNEKVDGGLDGFNYKISFEKGGPVYVMKVLWDTELIPPHYFAPQRECQNAALFQMMEAAVSAAANAPTAANTPAPGPILINPNPKTSDDAISNYLAFCDEKRAKRARQLAEGVSFPDLVSVTEMPRMRRCYGWMSFRGQELANRLPRGFILSQIKIDKLGRGLQKDSEYTAIIYEYIEQGA